MIFATGAAKGAARIETPPTARRGVPSRARQASAQSRAAVVRDGEGARKFITVNVEGAATRKAAKRIRALDRQLAAGQNGLRGRRRQLGRVVMAGRQGGREGRARQARHLLLARSVSPTRASAILATTKGDLRLYEGRLDRDHGQP